MRYTVDMKTFRDIIRAQAKQRGLSGYRIGKLSGVPIRTVQAYLAGTTDLSGKYLERICAAIGLALRPTRRRKTKVRS